MSTAAQLRDRAICALEEAGTELVYVAQRFNPQNGDERKYQTQNLYRVAREYAAAVRRLARLRA